jgi:hypothetical protein
MTKPGGSGTPEASFDDADTAGAPAGAGWLVGAGWLAGAGWPAGGCACPKTVAAGVEARKASARTVHHPLQICIVDTVTAQGRVSCKDVASTTHSSMIGSSGASTLDLPLTLGANTVILKKEVSVCTDNLRPSERANPGLRERPLE